MSLPVSLDIDELLAVTVSVDPASAVVTAAGEVDSSSAPRLVAAVETALTGEAAEVTVDLTAVSFLDSSGVHALAAGYRRAGAAGIRLRVLASGRAVMRPLQLTGLWPLLAADSGCTASASEA